MQPASNLSRDIYAITVRSIVDEGWVRALQVKPVETVRHYGEPARTTVTVEIIDQAELFGLLRRIHSGGLTLLSVALLSTCPRAISPHSNPGATYAT